MHLLSMGLNFKTAPIEVRERFSVDRFEQVFSNPRQLSTLGEWVILSTCNRAEVYAVTGDKSCATEQLQNFFYRLGETGHDGLKDALYTYTDVQTAHHLFEVASGLDSMVTGEAQILGQVRDAFAQADASGCTGVILSQLFQRAIHTGKRVRTETTIGRGAVSVSHAAIELACSIFDRLQGQRVLLVGAGRMTELAAKNLAKHDVGSILVANRTLDHAQQVAKSYGGMAVDFARLKDWLEDVDIVISSTSAPHFVIHYEMIKEVMVRRHGRSLFLVDLALPRDVEPAVDSIDGVFLYNVDDLEAVVVRNLDQRKADMTAAKRIVQHEVEKFEEWWKGRGALPVIRELRTRAETIRQDELDKTLRKLARLDERSKDLVKALSLAIVNKLLHEPTIRLKQNAGNETNTYSQVVLDLFGLDN